jgi:parallel beta-helix repeat protein
MKNRYLYRLVLVLIYCFASSIAGAEEVRIKGRDLKFTTLQEALVKARDGETIVLAPGTYMGNFIIDRPITIRSADRGNPAILDGKGTDSVVTIRSDDVHMEDLHIVHSGMKSSFKERWGDSGIIVYGYHRIELQGLLVSNCDYGIILLGTGDVLIQNSTIIQNRLTGIIVEGGKEMTIKHNLIKNNEEGIVITTLYAQKRIVMARVGSPDYQQKLKRMNELIDTTVKSSKIRIVENTIVDNGTIGIIVEGYSHEIDILENRIVGTGNTRKPDYIRQEKAIKWLQSAAGVEASPYAVMKRIAGSGISLKCDAYENHIERNLIKDNYRFGIVIDLSYDNLIAKNCVEGNRDGIYLLGRSQNNRINHNLVKGNQQCGIAIACYDLDKSRPKDNLISHNSLKENRFNAYDTAGKVLSDKELLKIVRNSPWPKSLKERVFGDPRLLKRALENRRKSLQAVHNRWDNGKEGNHYGDFDEVSEGFLDENKDGIGEHPHPIPGGDSVDHYPLSANRTDVLMKGVPLADFRP